MGKYRGVSLLVSFSSDGLLVFFTLNMNQMKMARIIAAGRRWRENRSPLLHVVTAGLMHATSLP